MDNQQPTARNTAPQNTPSENVQTSPQLQQQYPTPQFAVQNQQTRPIIQQPVKQYETIFCSTCGQQIAKVALACPFCGAPVLQNQPQQTQQPQQIIINNSNNNVNTNTIRNGGGYYGRERNKWTALLLCLFLGFVGAHKFYEGKIGTGLLYLFTFGLFCFGWGIDTLILLFKPNPYYV